MSCSTGVSKFSCEFSNVSNLIPVFLHTSFCSLWESLLTWWVSFHGHDRLPYALSAYLCDLTPTVSCISHLFQSELLRRCPGSIGPTLLCPWLLRCTINIGRWWRRAAGLSFGATCGARHILWWLGEVHRLALSVGSRCQWRWYTGVRLLTCRRDGRRWLQARQLSGRRVVRVMLRGRCDGRRFQAALGRW
jgi:hypothetical protein